MGLVQWFGLVLVVYGLGVFVQGLRSWSEVRSLSRQESRLRARIERLPADSERARLLAEQLAEDEDRIGTRLDRITLRRCFTWGLWS